MRKQEGKTAYFFLFSWQQQKHQRTKGYKQGHSGLGPRNSLYIPLFVGENKSYNWSQIDRWGNIFCLYGINFKIIQKSHRLRKAWKTIGIDHAICHNIYFLFLCLFIHIYKIFKCIYNILPTFLPCNKLLNLYSFSVVSCVTLFQLL